MNRRLICCAAALACLARPMQGADQFPFKKEEVQALIRAVAAKIEERFKGIHPEAENLGQRVEETLASDEPAEADENDRAMKLAAMMVQMNSEFNFRGVLDGVRGPVFDSSEAGYLQLYQDLENASTREAEEVWRWLQMAEAAEHLKWKEKHEVCNQRALGAARALVSRKPADAEAHALLGMTLEWSGEKQEVLQRALKLDPKQPLAFHALMMRRTELAFRSAVLRRPCGIDEKPAAHLEVFRALYDRPLDEEETAAFERQAQELRQEANRLLSMAEERADLVGFLKAAHSFVQFNFHKDFLAAAATRDLQEGFEAFVQRVAAHGAKLSFTVFADDAKLKTALRLAAGAPEATGTIIMMALIGDSMTLVSSGQRPKETRMEIIRETFDELLKMARADESQSAARACEGAFIMEFLLTVVLRREPLYLELLIRAVHLDPFRQRTQHMLMGLCLNARHEHKVSALVAALAQTELALLPGVTTRRTAAASASLMRDWPAAHRLMDACLKERPDDLGLLNQKAVTFLKESQSAAAQKKAAFYFSKIESLREKPEFKPSKGDLSLIASNHILFLMLGGKNDAARKELAVAQRDKLLDEKECAELEKLLP